MEHRLARLTLPADTTQVLAPIRTLLRALGEQLAAADRWVTATAKREPVAQRLMTVPGVGPVIALSFAATLETPTRFGGDAARASAYLGLVPREHSSGERHHKGRITKAGPPAMRTLLVQAAWSVLAVHLHRRDRPPRVGPPAGGSAGAAHRHRRARPTLESHSVCCLAR